MSYAVGLTGGIGCGKSTVAALFHELGVPIIDSDVISHQLTQAGGNAIPLIRAKFGSALINAAGALDRAGMRRLVFADPAAKRSLEAILHPLILAEMRAQALAASGAPYLMLVVPLLFEASNYRALVQRVLVVDCPEEIQVARTMHRSGLSEQEIRTIMAQQIARPERLKLADDTLVNDGSLDELRAQIMQLHQFYLGRSSGSASVRQTSS